jgi:hypothetical protein
MPEMHPRLPMTICAICREPVQELEMWEHERNRAVVFRATCHGKTDQAQTGSIGYSESIGSISRRAWRERSAVDPVVR